MEDGSMEEYGGWVSRLTMLALSSSLRLSKAAGWVYRTETICRGC